MVGVGKYAADRAKRVISRDEKLKGIQESSVMGTDLLTNLDILTLMLPQQVSSILHPSPASPAANKGWSGVVRRQLHDLGLLELFQNG